MDIVSHGLWGGVAFGRENKNAFWLAFVFGIAPDFLSFGIFFIQRLFGSGVSFDQSGPPNPADIPAYVHMLYNFTHSLFVFTVVFLLVSFVLRKPLLIMLAWPLHIVTDIFTHSYAFFPTPFLWPVSHYMFDGMNWGQPIIFFPNLFLLACAYFWFFHYKKKWAR